MHEIPDHVVAPDAAQDVERVDRELSWLFSRETVEQARLIDVADLNLGDDMIRTIGAGVNRLKQLRHDPRAQAELVRAMAPGERLVLCLWIMDMDLLDRIRSAPYPG